MVTHAEPPIQASHYPTPEFVGIGYGSSGHGWLGGLTCLGVPKNRGRQRMRSLLTTLTC